jgi:hypothetical protein
MQTFDVRALRATSCKDCFKRLMKLDNGWILKKVAEVRQERRFLSNVTNLVYVRFEALRDKEGKV